MRAVLVVVVGLACACHDRDRAKQPVAALPAPPPAPRPIATCDRYAAALDKASSLDVDAPIQDLLRDQAALVRAAARAPRDADRAELAVRCANGLVDLARVPSDDTYGIGSVGTGVVGGLAGSAPAPGSGSTSGAGPNCRRLFEALDRLSACNDLPDAVRDMLRQQRDQFTSAWSQGATDPSVQAEMENACRVAGDSLTQLLSQYHCP